MSRVFQSLVAAFGLTLLASGARAQVPPPPPPPPPPPAQPARDAPLKTGTASIRGRVVAEGTNAAVPRVEIRITTSDSPTGKTAETDANGRYELTGLAAGRYTVAASKPRYIRTSYGQTRPNGVGQPIDVADGQAISNINFRLQRAAAITGRIVDEFSEPVTDVQVMVTTMRYIGGERRMMPTGGRPASTNDLGEYRVFGLPPGQYYVSATLRSFMPGDSDDRSGYAPTYFPGTGNVSEAQRITVAAAQTLTGINMTLLPVRTARITGTAVDGEGKPLTGAMVMAMERAGFGMVARSPSQVRPDGTFTVGGVTPGNYILRTAMPGAGEAATAQVTVTDGDVTNVQLIATKPSVVRGRILIDRGATPPRPGALRLFAFSSEPMMGGGEARVKDDFTFELTMQTGHYLLRSMGAPTDEWYLHGVQQNGVDITDSGFDVAPNSTASELIVEMTQHPTEATGRVTDASGKVLRDVWVVMFSQDPLRWTNQTRYIGAARPSSNDAFKIRIPPGDYYIVAVSEADQGEWFDPEFLSPLRERATRVSMADGERKTIDLTLTEVK